MYFHLLLNALFGRGTHFHLSSIIFSATLKYFRLSNHVEIEIIYAMQAFFEGREFEPAIGVLAPPEFEGGGYAASLVDLDFDFICGRRVG